MSDFVTYDIARKLKNKGYRKNCYARYKGNLLLRNDGNYISIYNRRDSDFIVDAPLISQALAWLRKQKKLHIVCPYYEGKGFYFYIQEFGFGGRYNSLDKSDDLFESYEEAANAGIDYALDLV